MSKKFIVIVSFLGFTGSIFALFSKLTDGGKMVKYLTKEEPSSSCEQIDQVESSFFEFNGSSGEVIIRLRNKTAELNGNMLVVDVIESNGEGGFAGNGRAFKCQ